MHLPLKDKWIVVTRPSSQSQKFTQRLTDAGANVIPFPLLEISPTENIQDAKQQLSHINHSNLIIFVSVNAVKHCFKLIKPEVFSGLNIAAVGNKTAQALRSYDLDVCCSPQSPFNSEALLLLPELKKLSSNDRVTIIRGENGRDFLKKSLQFQGVQVNYINVYTSKCPQHSLNQLTKYHKHGQLNLILLTSTRSARNLFDLKGSEDDNTWLNHIELMAGSERIRQSILSETPHLGEVHSAVDPSDETLYQQLLNWAI